MKNLSKTVLDIEFVNLVYLFLQSIKSLFHVLTCGNTRADTRGFVVFFTHFEVSTLHSIHSRLS